MGLGRLPALIRTFKFPNYMLFNSFLFLMVFLPAVLGGFYIFSRINRRLAVLWLGISSLVFYALGSPPEHVLVLLGSIAANWLFGRAIIHQRSFKKLWLTLGVIFNLGLLGWFKYSLFLAGILGTEEWPSIALPLGISFYTFTQIAFLVDEYRSPRPYSMTDYFLFVTYFPHLIAGPILNHAQTIPQFEDPRRLRVSAQDVAAGLSIFAIGLCKKCILADHFAIYADQVFSTATSVPSLFMIEAWFGAIAYTLQIYFDFSAYSDMAVGISLLFGIRLPQNFNSPYQATSIIDFWRRWHISLSSFLRDYLYIPLGGNRKGPARRYINLLLTMLLGGLWHGAGWTFLV